MKLTTHLSLVPTLRMSGPIPLLQSWAFMACAGTLPFLEIERLLTGRRHREVGHR